MSDATTTTNRAARAEQAAKARARIWARLRDYERAFVQQYDYRFTPDEEYGEPPDEWYVPPDPEAYERRRREEAEEEACWAELARESPEPPSSADPLPYAPPKRCSRKDIREARMHVIDRERLRRPTAPHFGDRAWYHDEVADDEGTLWIPAADAARIMGVSLSAVRQWRRRHNKRTPWLPLPTLEGGHVGTLYRLYDVLKRALELEGGL